MDFDNRMQNCGVYVVYDSVVEEYGSPFVTVNNENAKRMAVAHLLTYPDNFISDHVLYEIGQFDPNTAKIEGYSEKVLVAGSKELLEKVYQLRKEYEDYKKEALDELEALKKLQSKEVK